MSELKKVPDTVKKSDFGCKNCLWNGVECTQGCKYQPKTNEKGNVYCDYYTYYD